MAETTPERRAAWEAEEARKAEKRKAQKAASAMARRKSEQAIKGEIDPENDGVRRLRWLEAYTGKAKGNGVRAAEMAGYAENSWHYASRANLKHFRARLAKLAEERLNRSKLIEDLHQDSQGVGEYIAWTGSSPDIVQTIENLREAGQLRQLVGAEVSQFGTKLKFRDPQKAQDTLVKIAGITAPTKVTGTLTVDGLTPAQIREQALAIIDQVTEEQRKMLNAPADFDYEEADYSDEYEGDEDSD